MASDSRHLSILNLPGRVDLDPSAPLRLSVAAAIAFPDGSMSASGLRREAARGRLVIERIAGKDFTTLANISEMRQRCHVEARDRAYGVGLPAKENPPSGSSKTPEGSTPRDALQTRLKLNRQKRQKKH
jgi:hypothetical protein